MNPNESGQFFNPDESKVGMIRIENSVWIILTSDSFGLRTSFGLIWIGSLILSRIEFWLWLKILDWHGLIFNRFTSNKIENSFRIESDELKLVWIHISEWVGINLIGSEWISMWNFYQGTNWSFQYSSSLRLHFILIIFWDTLTYLNIFVRHKRSQAFQYQW